jgi:organic radical activating enzyme
MTLRSVADHKGDELVDRVIRIVRKYRPLHLSIVGGEPLVRFRELNELLPKLSTMGVNTQLVTSAVRTIRTTLNLTANLEDRVVPCQFGGTPDCSQSGCIASAGLAAIGEHKLLKVVPLKSIYRASHWIGKSVGPLMDR